MRLLLEYRHTLEWGVYRIRRYIAAKLGGFRFYSLSIVQDVPYRLSDPHGEGTWDTNVQVARGWS